MLLKLSIFISSEDCIRKITSNASTLYPVFITKKMNLIKSISLSVQDDIMDRIVIKKIIIFYDNPIHYIILYLKLKKIIITYDHIYSRKGKKIKRLIFDRFEFSLIPSCLRTDYNQYVCRGILTKH